MTLRETTMDLLTGGRTKKKPLPAFAEPIPRSTILNRAADLIVQYGHMNASGGKERGRMCVLKAIGEAEKEMGTGGGHWVCAGKRFFGDKYYGIAKQNDKEWGTPQAINFLRREAYKAKLQEGR